MHLPDLRYLTSSPLVGMSGVCWCNCVYSGRVYWPEHFHLTSDTELKPPIIEIRQLPVLNANLASTSVFLLNRKYASGGDLKIGWPWSAPAEGYDNDALCYGSRLPTFWEQLLCRCNYSELTLIWTPEMRPPLYGAMIIPPPYPQDTRLYSGLPLIRPPLGPVKVSWLEG